MVASLFLGCLVNNALYEQRLRELADHDGDGVASEDDCDDADPTAFPGANEVCDEIDQDCDGEVDEDAVDAPAWYLDRDGDGRGSAADMGTGCDAPDDTVANADDCDDARGDVYPGAPETAYDRVDQDCDGSDLVDVDGDGHAAREAAGEDCDDRDAGIHPSAADTPYDGIDQDCNGTDLTDADGDGDDAVAGGGFDCDDTDPTIFSTAVEDWANGATDNDCDGQRGDAVLEYGDLTWVGAVPGGQAGRRIVPLDDLDGDGLPDLLVGAPYDETWEEFGGAATVLTTDGSGGLLAVARAEGRDAGAFLGTGLSSGDADLDGLTDLILAASGRHTAAGEVWVVPGAGLSADIQLERDAILSVVGEDVGTYSGAEVAVVGDLDGDGMFELAIGAPLSGADEHPGAGAVALLSGDQRGSVSFADGIVVTGPYAWAGLGNRAFGIGDQDGDGKDDLVLGIAYGDVAAVVLGGDVSSADVEAIEILRLTGSEAITEADIWPAGDLNGDGLVDLAAVYNGYDVRTYTELLAFSERGVADWTNMVIATQNVHQLGSPGDLDGDGKDELFVPSGYEPSYLVPVAGLFFAADYAYRQDVPLLEAPLLAVSTRGGGAGYRFALPGDIDGDGVDEIAMGACSDDAGGVEAGGVTLLPVPR